MNYRQTVAKITSLLATLNRESKEVFLNIPGIGPKTADKIIALRENCEKNGRLIGFRDMSTIIGPGTLAKLTGDVNTPCVIKYIELCSNLYDSGTIMDQAPRSILSLDLGIHNSAYVLLDKTYTIREWKKLELNVSPPYNPKKYFEEVERSLQLLPHADVCIIEEQSHRNPSNKGFLSISIQLRALEAMAYSVSRLTKRVPVHTLPSNRVARYFGISSKTSREKKKLGVELVMKLLDAEKPLLTPFGERVSFSPELLEYFEKESKKDDLSDCLLQALAVMDWCCMTQQLHRSDHKATRN